MFTSTVKVGGTSDRAQTQSAAPPSEVAGHDSERTVQSDASTDISTRDIVGPQLRNPERYHIMGEHGRGGLGRVSRAHDRELGRDVAIKELISRSSVDEVRFLREALITARLEHPGIVPVHEAGRWPDGTPFYAMKLVSGRSLRDLIAERPQDQRISLLPHVIAVADAIAYAHGRNIIHRDLKPGNVIVGDFGETIVIDWGLAKDITAPDESVSGEQQQQQQRSSDEELTAAGSVLGTPAYMAPEQKRGEHVDQRADVFAIGAMLWELCSPRKTLPAGTVQRHRMLRRAGVDKDLVAIIDKALDPDPAARYADAGDLAADLKAFESGARIAARSYSLYAMLTHWTSRHRAIALTVLIAIAVSAVSAVVYVRNIKAARDRADAALASAQRERDRAKLSEAAAQLENDPNRARDVLDSLTVHTPQYALLTSRMNQLSAARVVPVTAVVDGLYRAPGSAVVELTTRDGQFHRLDPVTAEMETLDHDLISGVVAYRSGQWIYARRTYGAGSVRLASPSQSNLFDADLPSATQLAALTDAVYALDSTGDLHRLDGKTAAVVEHGVRSVVGDGELRLVCKTTGELEITRKDEPVYRGRCPATGSQYTMAAVHDDYAALTADRNLIASRGGHTLEVPTPIRGEYELALSNAGVIALADYGPDGKAWFVRPDGKALEPGPAHGAHPFSLAVDGNLAAWGYVDGIVMVLDTATGTVWPLRGHPGMVSSIAVDAANARVLAGGLRELRVWQLKQPAGTLVQAMPCVISHMQHSPDGRQVAADCNDGSVRLWSRDSNAMTVVHSHVGQSFGVEWLGDRICSGGFIDGKVICSRPDGSDLKTLDSGTGRIVWMTSGPDFLIFTGADGRVWRYDGTLQELYTHNSAYRVAISPDGRMVASCGLDGTLAIYDLANRRLLGPVHDHTQPAYYVAWVGDEIWTSGFDGAIKTWEVRDGAPRLRRTLQAPASVHYMKALAGRWAANSGESNLLIGRDNESVALRLDMGRPIDTLDVSPDLRYVAAGVNGEIVIVDMKQDAIATMTIGSPRPKFLSFLDATSLAFSEVGTFKTVAVDHLDFVPFQTTAEP